MVRRNLMRALPLAAIIATGFGVLATNRALADGSPSMDRTLAAPATLTAEAPANGLIELQSSEKSTNNGGIPIVIKPPIIRPDKKKAKKLARYLS